MTQKPQRALGIRVLRTLVKVLAITLGLIAILIGLFVWSQSEWQIDARRLKIRAEIAAMEASHPWAGTYYRGDGLGCNELLSVSERAGFQYTNHGCCGLYGHAHGSADAIGSRVTLHEWVTCLPAGQFGEYEVVNWGSRRYLVEPRQLLDFVNDVNARDPGELACWPDRSFYLRVGDEEKAAEGQPTLPEEFRRLLLASPVEGHILRVGETSSSTLVVGPERDFEIEIDLGSADKVFEGMRLQCEGDSFWRMVILKQVGAHSSHARLKLSSTDLPPQVGWLVYSSRGR